MRALTWLVAGAAVAMSLAAPAPALAPLARVGPGVLRPVYMPEPGITEINVKGFELDRMHAGRRRVGRELPNFWGIYDLHGLVWEWVLDFNGTLSTGMIDHSSVIGVLDRGGVIVSRTEGITPGDPKVIARVTEALGRAARRTGG